MKVTEAIGNGGQRLFLIPELDMAIVTAAGAYNDAAINTPLNEILRRITATVSA